MNVVVPGLKDRRVAEAGGSQTSISNWPEGEVDDGKGSIRANHNIAKGRNTGRITEINTIVLELCYTAIAGQQDNKQNSPHFVISPKGDIFYLRDIASCDDNSPEHDKILIQFEGNRQHTTHRPQSLGLSREAIIAGRRLVSYFSSSLPKLKFISQHDNSNCEQSPGDRVASKDLWINVGAWAVAKLYLKGDGLTTPATQQTSQRNDNKPREDRESWPLLDSALLGARP